VITTPLTLIVNVSFDEPIETIFNVPVLVNVTQVIVAHHIFVDHVAVVVQTTVNITVAKADHVFPAKSVKLNVYVPFHVNSLLIVPVIVSDPLSVAKTFAHVFV